MEELASREELGPMEFFNNSAWIAEIENLLIF